MVAVYGIENEKSTFTVIPKDMTNNLNEKKMQGYWEGKGVRVEPSMQIGIEGDWEADNLTAGRTYRNREQAFRFKVPEFFYSKTENEVKLIAEYKSDNLLAKQYFEWQKDSECITTFCEVKNVGARDIVLESVPSFNISRISPFITYNDESEINVYKVRNNWSAEGALIKTPLKELRFEESWCGQGIQEERFGQCGSMPTNGYLPWVAVEDVTHDVVWAIEIEAPAAWQIELCNVYNGVSISGGQADFLFGHWKKNLKSGESFITRKAFITVCHGGVNRACSNLVHEKTHRRIFNKIEETMPLMYNEYCYTWGNPSEKFVEEQLALCKELGFKYFVIDAGWYCKEGSEWRIVGDWELNTKRFPSGLKALSNKCKENGMKLGIWFEFESVSINSEIAQKHPEWLLTYCGKTICHSGRCMFDMRKNEVIEYLKEKVINFVKDNNIGYIKIDYNEPIGIGVDGAESLGEGLRLQTEASIAFYKLLRKENPELVIEICSSGGMRHEATWQALGNMCSFSDAHEGKEGAVIAANLHRFIPPSQMQVWAVLRDDYNDDEIVFTLAKSLLGRPCLSGNLQPRKNEIIKFIKYYNKIKEIIKDGESFDIQNNITSLRNIQGVQTLKRVSKDKSKMLVYCFSSNKNCSKTSIDIKGYELQDFYGNVKVKQEGDILLFGTDSVDFSGTVAYLKNR